MQDHYTLFPFVNEPVLGKSNVYSPRNFLQKSKRKKLSSEFEERSSKKEDLLLYQKLFHIFEAKLSTNELLSTLIGGHNKQCDGKDRNQSLQEVP